MSKDLERSLRDLMGTINTTTLSNIVMRIPDKLCAAAFSMLSDDVRDSLYEVIGNVKAERIREEIRIERRRRTSASVRAGLVRTFLAYFKHQATQAPAIWIRPVRRRRELEH